MSRVKTPFPILMAEDDEDYFLVAEEAFKQFNLPNPLKHVTDGEELMDYLLRRGRYRQPADSPRPGVIFLDLNMPRKTGLEALKEIKANPELCHIPVVMLTISKDEKDIETSYDLGAASFITKPLTFHGLVEVLKVFKQYWFEIVELPRKA
ncbi:MAG: two-component system response regulator [Omnitrophica bacterium RIFCSPHIGHO2_02_FULL_63_14]|nr:MAG: two-component system response regulator [Omnitrophica bacterium RIFCSPHIGHO2_02_FULL_63_14]